MLWILIPVRITTQLMPFIECDPCLWLYQKKTVEGQLAVTSLMLLRNLWEPLSMQVYFTTLPLKSPFFLNFFKQTTLFRKTLTRVCGLPRVKDLTILLFCNYLQYYYSKWMGSLFCLVPLIDSSLHCSWLQDTNSFFDTAGTFPILADLTTCQTTNLYYGLCSQILPCPSLSKIIASCIRHAEMSKWQGWRDFLDVWKVSIKEKKKGDWPSLI